MSESSLEAHIGQLLRARGWTIAVAESCTGGLVMHRLTNVAGSSAYFLGGVVAYADPIKEQLLRVRRETLVIHGAVSERVAAEMATGARAVFGATLAISLTGIAGPGGGTPEKPVGLTFIGLAGLPGRLIVRRHQGEGDREANKSSSADSALRLLLETLEGA